MIKLNKQVLNQISAILLIVSTVNCQVPMCGFKAMNRHLELDDNVMRENAAHIVAELQIGLDRIKECANKYVQKHNTYTDIETFYETWHELHEIPWLQGYLGWNFQDRPDITRSEFTARVRQLIVPFNRILHYLNITGSANTPANTVVQSTLTKSVNRIRDTIIASLNTVLCQMYLYLAEEDSDLHVESAFEFNQHVQGSILDKEEIVSGLLYVYLVKTFDQFLNSADLFANS